MNDKVNQFKNNFETLKFILLKSTVIAILFIDTSTYLNTSVLKTAIQKCLLSIGKYLHNKK